MPPANELTDKYPRLGAIISRVQSRFILGGPTAEVFDPLLTDLLEFTASEYGFIAEVLNDAQDGHCFLRVSVLTDVSWDDETRAMFERHRSGAKPMEFHRLDTLFGAAVTTGQAVIANDPRHDPRWSGRLPGGHLALNAFLGLPLFHGGVLAGVVGLANRRGGYDQALVDFLQPLTASVGAILGAVRLDVARREAELALRASEERLRATFEMAAVGIAHVSPQGRFVRVNRKLCEIFGRSATEMTALSYLDVTLPADRATDAVQVQRLIAGEVSGYVGQKRYLHADGHTVWCNLSVALVRDEGGAPEYFIAVVEDITGRKQMEAAMLAAQAAERANAAKTEFLSHMSHELRTPLNAVLGFAQLLRLDASHPLPAVQRDMVRHIEDAGLHLLAMIDDVLDLARIEGGGFALEPVAVPLDALLDEAVALVAGMARDAGVRIARAGAPAPAHVLADQRRARQVFVNLLSNAVKYNHRGGSVTLTWGDGPEPGTLRIEIADTGPGLSPEQLEHLFEPFNRLGAERSPVQGTGIGLVITQRLVHLMGGRLQVQSQAGAGSRFSVVLSAAPAPQTVAAADAPAAVAAPGGPAALRNVLYAEDNPMNVELVRELMRLRPACSLTVARSGAQAIELAREHAPDLLLLDMHLGDMTALDVKRSLDDVPALAPRPWVVLSADAMPATIAAAHEAGFVDYLTKPLEVTRFLRCIDERLGIEGQPAA